MPLALPAMTQSIAYGVAIMLGCFGTWYLGKFIVKWLQAYRDHANTQLATDARAQAQVDSQKANAESDALKNIDAR